MTNDVQSTILETIPSTPEEAKRRVRSLVTRNARDEMERDDFLDAILGQE